MNTTLKSLNDIIPELRFLASLNALHHPTFFKNWDLALFTRFIVEHYPQSAAILDIGCVSNPLIFNLADQGYKNLWGIDFQMSPTGIHPHPNILYMKADLMRTPFKDHQFDCITSLSVVEHGVNLDHYFAEMARILKPGATLLTSTDYWPKKIRTWAVPRKTTFGLPWTIFSKKEIRQLVAVSHQFGFKPLAPLDCSVGEPTVHYFGKAYTFIAFALENNANR